MLIPDSALKAQVQRLWLDWTDDSDAEGFTDFYTYLSNDMLKANYSNSRLALLKFRRRVEAYRHAVMVWQICRRIWAHWMDVAALIGALAIPDYERRRRGYLGCA